MVSLKSLSGQPTCGLVRVPQACSTHNARMAGRDADGATNSYSCGMRVVRKVNNDCTRTSALS